MRNPGGYLSGTAPEGVVVAEHDTFTCAHCNRVVMVRPKERPEDIGGFCGGCSGLICGPCADDPGCTPIEKRLEAWERRTDTLRSYGMSG